LTCFGDLVFDLAQYTDLALRFKQWYYKCQCQFLFIGNNRKKTECL